VEFSIFIIGLIFGSFLNVLIYRLTNGISLIDPARSICTNCNNIIAWYHNIPIISFIILNGRCAYCQTKISFIYPIIELITAIITLVLYLSLGFSNDFIIILIVFYVLIVLSFIDFNLKAVPDYLLLIVLLISIFYSSFSIHDALLFAGAFILLEQFITFYIQNIKYKITKDENLLTQKALGEGDIPIVALIGGILHIQLGIVSIVLAAILAIIPSIYNIIKNKDIQTAFIPYLSLGLLIVFIFRDIIIRIVN
jgi:leader peptidase (prepilin peptidase)/N-methyltransferase